MDTEMFYPFSDKKKLQLFYRKWSVNASKLIRKYAMDHSLDWFNTKWRNKSKEIFFYISSKDPKGNNGNIWFMSKPTNYAYAKTVGKIKASRKAIPKKVKVKPVHAYGRWFKPKTYTPQIDNIDASISTIDTDGKRFFASKTSHDKTHKYKKPMVWYQRQDGKVGFVNLKEQLADKVAEDLETSGIIMEAFEMTMESFNK